MQANSLAKATTRGGITSAADERRFRGGMTRILVADDHEVVLQGLKVILADRKDWQVCAQAHTGREAVEKAIATRPDVAILDISMPELNGLEAAQRIKQSSPETEIVILSIHHSDEVLSRILRSGAKGYVLKSDAGKELASAVEAVSHHRKFFTSHVSDLIVQRRVEQSGQAKDTDVTSVLTLREREIVQMVAEGKSSKEIGSILNISVKTVETHRTNITRKLNFHSLSDLVRYAIRNKLIEP